MHRSYQRDSIRLCIHADHHNQNLVYVNYSILHHADVAEWVLNKCALEEIDDGDIVDFIDFNADSETSEGKSPRSFTKKR